MRVNTPMMIAALCALAVPLQAQGAERRASTGATGGKAVKAAPAIASPPAGMGQVVFYRSSKKGMLIGCKVRENEVAVNKLSAGKYFVHPTTPGAHEYMVKSEAKDRLRLEVEEGETHYVRCSIGMGIAVGRPNLSPQSRADFDKRGKKLKLQSPYKGDAEEAEPASGTN